MTTFSRVWAMPSRWTFQIPPIAEFVRRHIAGCGVVVDPFCGVSKMGTHNNDLANGGVDASEYCRSLAAGGLVADAILFDPPYSPRQILECYKSIGRTATTQDTQNAALYARVRAECRWLLRPGCKLLSFGWNSTGFGKEFDTTEILLVAHGGAHNDTICVAQVVPQYLEAAQ